MNSAGLLKDVYTFTSWLFQHHAFQHPRILLLTRQRLGGTLSLISRPFKPACQCSLRSSSMLAKEPRIQKLARSQV